MNLKIPKIDISKIEKRYLIAGPVILLLIILTMCMEISQRGGSPTDTAPRQDTQEETQNNIEHTVWNYQEDENFFDYSKEVSVEENNQWNLNKGGLIARHADYYYYADERFGMLYRVRIDGTGREKLDYSTKVGNINIDAGWIYFTSREFNQDDDLIFAKVHKLNLNDGRRTSSDIHADVMIVDQTHIYFTNIKDNNRLYRVNHDFQNLQRITDDTSIKAFYLQDEHIYYLDSSAIKRVNRDGTNKQIEVETPNIKSFIIDQDRIFYITQTDNRLFAMPKGRASERELLMSDVYEIYIYGDRLYYSSSARGGLEITRVRDTSVNLGRLTSGRTHTVLGNVLFSSRDANALGYSQKTFLDVNRNEPLAIDTREVRLGLNEEMIRDHVTLNIDYDDRNTITRNMFNRLGEFFDGNSYPLFSDFGDIDRNFLNEGFIIFRQYVSINSNEISGLGKHNDTQAGLYVLRWDENDLQILGPYPLRNERDIARGEFVRPILRLNDVTRDGNNEVLIDIKGTRDIRTLELFKVYPIHIEPIDPNDFEERLSIFGY